MEFGTVLVRRFGIRTPATVQASFAAALDIQTSPVEERQAAAAALGYATYGRGSGHRACLNFGDCFAYALSKVTGEPLLFKGNDFNHTDLLLAPESAFPR
ncbi:MAG: ribonuclease [Sphingomonas bacterium]|nr:ribonuclease [Sphingomonas bacterium]